MTTMIFHAPYPLGETLESGSAVRPQRMRQAFIDAGYEVLDITGYAAERRRRFRAVRRRIEMGQPIDFVYCENATIPPSITEAKHLPPHPWLDTGMLRYFSSQGIPVGVFYRDIYWMMPDYPKRVGRPLAAAMRLLYRWELEVYRQWTTTVYVPSLGMTERSPQLTRLAQAGRVKALPPGGLTRGEVSEPSPLSLIYVGGIGGHYHLHELVEAVKARPDVHLTICAERKRWEAEADSYQIDGYNNIDVKHATNEDLDPLYERANLAVLAVRPEEYWQFAVPVKFYEYIGRAKPILATTGTFVTTMVDELSAGFTCAYDREAITGVLDDLVRNPDRLRECAEHVSEIRHDHSWVARAKWVREDLLNCAN